MLCDLCNVDVSSAERVVLPNAEARELISAGFGIDETNVEMLTSAGMQREEAIKQLQAVYLESQSDWLLCSRCEALAIEFKRQQTEITKHLGLAIADEEVGRISKDQLLTIFQEAIENGDILEEDNHLHVVAYVVPLIDAGVLQPSQHLGAFEGEMDRMAMDFLAERRGERSQAEKNKGCLGVLLACVTLLGLA